MDTVLEPSFAGSFYPSDPRQLSELVRKLAGPREPLPGSLGMVVPHAGMVYSGRTAGMAYARAPGDVSRVVLCAPSHRAFVRGAVLLDAGELGTPLGNVRVDRQAFEGLRKRGVGSAVMAEHSIEVQLPFMLARWPGVSVIPVVTVSDDPSFLFELAGVLYEEAPDAFFVASSDLSHYHGLARALKLDSMVREAFLTLSPDALLDALARGGEACGRAAMITLLHFAALAGGNRAVEIDYSTSADAGAGEKQVVGYFSGMIVREA
ncbi:MAG: AmmeMemoRadiSam system protein B [Candidatus Fermentibacteraceae bacterium]